MMTGAMTQVGIVIGAIAPLFHTATRPSQSRRARRPSGAVARCRTIPIMPSATVDTIMAGTARIRHPAIPAASAIHQVSIARAASMRVAAAATAEDEVMVETAAVAGAGAINRAPANRMARSCASAAAILDSF
jgi:hypothetical protein